MNAYSAPRTADRSLPRKSLVMYIPAQEMGRCPEPVLPEGYSFRLYRPGDLEDKARLGVLTEEFDTMEQARAHFEKYTPLEEEGERMKRMVFVISPEGKAVATSTAWWFEEEGRRYGRVHWVMTDPDHQGKGLGRAVVAWALCRLHEMENGLDVYLDTQTWSHKAIGLYLRMGFHPAKQDHPVLRAVNEYDGVVQVLRDVLPEETMNLFLDMAQQAAL